MQHKGKNANESLPVYHKKTFAEAKVFLFCVLLLFSRRRINLYRFYTGALFSKLYYAFLYRLVLLKLLCAITASYKESP